MYSTISTLYSPVQRSKHWRNGDCTYGSRHKVRNWSQRTRLFRGLELIIKRNDFGNGNIVEFCVLLSCHDLEVFVAKPARLKDIKLVRIVL